MAYTYLAADLATGELIPPELPFTGVKWGRRLNGAGRLSATLQMPPPVNADDRRLAAAYKNCTDRKRRVIYVLRDGAAMGAWLIHERSYDLTTQAITIAALELPSYWSSRLFGYAAPGHLTLRQVGPDVPIQVALDILTAIAPSMHLDLTGVTAPTSGPTVAYEGRLADGKNIGSIIDDLSNAEGDLGFDYRVDLAGAGNTFTRRLVMARHLGADVGLIAKLTRPAGMGNIVAGGIVEDARRANFVAALGSGDGATRATGEAVGSDWEPRCSTTITVQDETSTAVLDARAAAHLRLIEHMSLPEISLRSDQIDAQLGTFSPGDIGRVSIEADSDPWWPDGAWLTQRIIDFDVAVPDTGDSETVTFRFDDPAGDF